MGDSESDDDQPPIYIERGDQRESFSPEEANVAKAVQNRFSLYEEPNCVFSVKTSKPVAFGKLKPGIIYKLKGEENISKEQDVEPDIYIEKDGTTNNFSPVEANEGKTVQRAFSLDHEPACVFSVRTGNRVDFGKLKPGFKYKLEEEGKIPNQRRHIQNAVIMASAVYSLNQTEYLTKSSEHHTIQTVCAISEHSDQGVMLAVGLVEKQNVLYAAFRGTQSWEDAVADADIQLRHKEEIPGGTFHSGFEKRSRVLPWKQILHCAQQEDCQTIVLCGHSLGGAVAAISAIEVMMHLRDNAEMSTHCITFGAPLFANEDVRLHCQKGNFDQQMIHFVGYQDIVPGILSLGHTLSEIKKRARSALSEATGERLLKNKAKPFQNIPVLDRWSL